METYKLKAQNISDEKKLFIAYKTYVAAFDRTTKTLEEREIKYDEIPLLHSRSEAFDKRFADSISGKKERVNLSSKLKKFIRENLHDYRFDKNYSFRKKLTSELDGLLQFEPVNHWGLGKSFTIRYAVESRLINAYRGKSVFGYFSFSIFELFQKAWEEPCWMYTTGEDLQTVFTACKTFLLSTLPVLEQTLIQMFSPWPAVLPNDIGSYGELTGRQAYDLALPIAQSWAGRNNVDLISLENAEDLSLRDLLGPGTSKDGRLKEHGYWQLYFLCPARKARIFIKIPHTGKINQNIIVSELSCSPLASMEWVDSPVIASKFDKLREEHIKEGTFESFRLGFKLSIWRQAAPCWEATLLGCRIDSKGRKRDDLRILFDAYSGEEISDLIN